MHACSYVFSVHKGWAKQWDIDHAKWGATLDTIDAETVGNVSRCQSTLGQAVRHHGDLLADGDT